MKLYRLTYLEGGSRDQTLRMSLENVKKSIAFWSKVHRRYIKFMDEQKKKGINVSNVHGFSYVIEEADVEWKMIHV